MRTLSLSLPVFVGKFMQGQQFPKERMLSLWEDTVDQLQSCEATVMLGKHFANRTGAVAKSCGLGGALTLHTDTISNSMTRDAQQALHMHLAGAFPRSNPMNTVLARLNCEPERVHIQVKSDDRQLALATLNELVFLLGESFNEGA